MTSILSVRNIFLLLSFYISVSFAQFSEKTEKNQSSGTTQNPSYGTLAQLSVSRIVQDGPVDGKEYIVGPGDIFSVNIWTSVPLSFQVPVTPEGTVIIPSVTELNISGMTLDSAKKIVTNEIRKKIMTGSVSFSLFSPRSFIVTVLGAVITEGPIVVQSTQRVDAALMMANDPSKLKEKNTSGLSEQKSVLNVLKKNPVSSRRHITIRRKNGTTVLADIEKFLATYNTQCNPLLLDGDIVIVQPKNITQDFVALYGAVSKEGTFEFSEGDSLSLLLQIAGGVTSSVAESGSIIYRTGNDGEQKQIEFDALSVLAKKQPDIILQKGDRIVVASRINTMKTGVVSVEGEVLSPGSYPIIRDSTTLSQVIKMAGGLTSFASLSASHIYRISNSNLDGFDSTRLKRGRTTSENYEYIVQEVNINALGTTVLVDFQSLFGKGDLKKDVPLQNGDRIIVVPKSNSVYVFGEVRSPGFVPFAAGKDAEYYLALVGGITKHSDEGDIRVIKASTKQWLEPGETTIEEGDYLWVPKESYRTFSYYLSVYSQVFGIVGTVISLFILSAR